MANVGRIFFEDDVWIVQTLHSHVDNVVKLAELWEDNFPQHRVVESTHERLIKAARIHDIAKPAYFRLKKNERNGWVYSFSAHRFNAFDDDPYVQALVRLHHEYSVKGITTHIAQLLDNPETMDIARKLPVDLYALEMCDQIEATIATAIIGETNPEARVFMDFQFNTLGVGNYQIEPFVFAEDPVHLTVEYKELPIENMQSPKLMQKWVIDALKDETFQYKEATLCRWI